MNLIEEKLRLVEMSVNEVVETLQDRGEGVQLKASEMLRQQQVEIDRLKALCISYIDEEWSGTSSYQAKIDEVNEK